MYEIVVTNAFKKDLKLLQKRGYDMEPLNTVVDILISGKRLPGKYREHVLIGNYAKCKECHILSNWLLIYEIDENEAVIYLTRTGTHSDLF